jgi:hypothetical protein
VRFETLILQIPAAASLPLHHDQGSSTSRYVSDHLALFHGPRKLGDYDEKGKVISQKLKQAT